MTTTELQTPDFGEVHTEYGGVKLDYLRQNFQLILDSGVTAQHKNKLSN